MLFLSTQKVAVQAMDGPKPPTPQLQPRPHLSKDVNRLADVRLALSTQARDCISRIGLRAHVAFLIHIAEMRSVNTHKCSVVNCETDQRSFHEDFTIVTNANELCHLPRCPEGFPGAVSPESIRDAVLVRWERWLVERSYRLEVTDGKEWQICSVESDDGEEVDDVHEGIGRQGILVHYMRVSVAGTVSKISRKPILELDQELAEVAKTRLGMPWRILISSTWS